MLKHLPAVTACLTELAKEWQFRQEFSMTGKLASPVVQILQLQDVGE